MPIRSMFTALVADPDKGKGREDNDDMDSGSEDGTDSGGSASDESTRSRRRLESRRRRAFEQSLRKEPGRHRVGCGCHACTSEAEGPPCWSCGATRAPPPPRPRYHPGPQPVIVRNGYPRQQQPRPRDRERERRRGVRPAVPLGEVVEEPVTEERMSKEDIRTWSLAFSLSIDVYVCAERYLMQDFKAAISAFIINR